MPTVVVSFPHLEHTAEAVAKSLNLSYRPLVTQARSGGEKSILFPPLSKNVKKVFFIHSMRPSYLYEDMMDGVCALNFFHQNHLYVEIFFTYFPFLRSLGKSDVVEENTYAVYKNMLKIMGVERVHILDPHVVEPWITPISIAPFLPYILEKDTLVVLPDAGAARRYGAMLQNFSNKYLTLKKTRFAEDDVRIESEEAHRIKGRSCLILDDMFATGCTMTAASKYCTSQGAVHVKTYATHVVSTNTIETHALTFAANSLVSPNISSQMLNITPALVAHMRDYSV